VGTTVCGVPYIIGADALVVAGAELVVVGTE
jgi:hypothetical protein